MTTTKSIDGLMSRIWAAEDTSEESQIRVYAEALLAETVAPLNARIAEQAALLGAANDFYGRREKAMVVQAESLKAKIANLEADNLDYAEDESALNVALKARGNRIAKLEAALAAQEAVEPDTLQLIAQSYERMRHDGRQFAAEQAEAAAKIADLTKCLAECEGALECCGHPIEQAEAPAGFALVPLKPNAEMECLFAEGEWEWRDVLAAAEAITEEQHAGISEQAEALKDAAAAFLEAQDAMDNNELMGPNAEPHTLVRSRRDRARNALDAAIAGAEGAQS